MNPSFVCHKWKLVTLNPYWISNSEFSAVTFDEADAIEPVPFLPLESGMRLATSFTFTLTSVYTCISGSFWQGCIFHYFHVVSRKFVFTYYGKVSRPKLKKSTYARLGLTITILLPGLPICQRLAVESIFNVSFTLKGTSVASMCNEFETRRKCLHRYLLQCIVFYSLG